MCCLENKTIISENDRKGEAAFLERDGGGQLVFQASKESLQGILVIYGGVEVHVG